MTSFIFLYLFENSEIFMPHPVCCFFPLRMEMFQKKLVENIKTDNSC